MVTHYKRNDVNTTKFTFYIKSITKGWDDTLKSERPFPSDYFNFLSIRVVSTHLNLWGGGEEVPFHIREEQECTRNEYPSLLHVSDFQAPLLPISLFSQQHFNSMCFTYVRLYEI